MDWAELFRVLALVLILEGLMPFLAPQRWRQVLLQLAQLDPRQLRGVGLVLILVGVITLNLL